MDTEKLTEFEVKVLRTLAGEPGGIDGWGAAVSVALEYLKGRRFCTGGPNYRITEAGRDALKAEAE